MRIKLKLNKFRILSKLSFKEMFYIVRITFKDKTVYKTFIIFDIRFNRDSFAEFHFLYDSPDYIDRSDKAIPYIIFLCKDKYNQISNTKICIERLKSLFIFSYKGI